MGIFDRLFGKKKDEKKQEDLQEVIKSGRSKSEAKVKETVSNSNERTKPTIHRLGKGVIVAGKEGTKPCDLCNYSVVPTKLTRVPIKEIQQAVDEGFNPFKIPDIDMSQVTMVSQIAQMPQTPELPVEQLYQTWQRMVLNDTTDWFLCSKCIEAFRSFQNQKGRKKNEEKTKVEELWFKAVALHNRGRFQEALQLYDEYLAIKPDSAEALTNKGTALLQIGKPEDAIRPLSRALVIAPNFPPALNNMGNALKDLGMYEKAIQFYDKALLIEPNLDVARYNRKLAKDLMEKIKTKKT